MRVALPPKRNTTPGSDDAFSHCAAKANAATAAAAGAGVPSAPEKFTVLTDFGDHPLIPKLQQFLTAVGITVAGIEFVEDADGNCYVYDVNTNTNYNSAAEQVGVCWHTHFDRNHVPRTAVLKCQTNSELARKIFFVFVFCAVLFSN